MREATDDITRFIAGLDAACYRASAMARTAVERKFEIIGEVRLISPRFELMCRLPALNEKWVALLLPILRLAELIWTNTAAVQISNKIRI